MAISTVPYSIYLHIPFCRHRCGYCDFNTYAGLDNLIPGYLRALRAEAQALSASAGEKLPVHTIFFGGGTPSLLQPAEVESVLVCLQACFRISPDVEITLEANPGTVTREYWQELRQIGINRLSLGMQSANPGELALLERQHGYPEVVQAVTWARQAGFDNLNLDLIFGLPHQELESWQRSLELALGLHPEHLSLYALTLEHGTPLARWAERGLLTEPDPDMAADMYEWAAGRLELAGYTQYEISNWTRQRPDGSSNQCRHNLQYWHNLPYLGLGAGAHGYAGGVRTANVLSPAAYIQRLQSGAALTFPRTPATQEARKVDRQAEIGETMMMGLRLTQEGIGRGAFLARFSEDVEAVFPKEITRLLGQGLLEWGGEHHDRLRLTGRGRLLGNRVFSEFV